MTVPSRGGDAPGRSQWPSPRGRALPRAQGALPCPVARIDPGRAGAAAEETGAPACPGQPLHLPPHAPDLRGSLPLPALFVIARLPVCGRRPRLTSRAGKTSKAASFSETCRPSGLLLLPSQIPPQPVSPRGVAAARSCSCEWNRAARGLTLEGAVRPSWLERTAVSQPVVPAARKSNAPADESLNHSRFCALELCQARRP